MALWPTPVILHLQLKFFLGISLHRHWHIYNTLYCLAVRIMHGEGDWREAAMGAAWLTILLTMKHLGKTQRYRLAANSILYMGLDFSWPCVMKSSRIAIIGNSTRLKLKTFTSTRNVAQSMYRSRGKSP